MRGSLGGTVNISRPPETRLPCIMIMHLIANCQLPLSMLTISLLMPTAHYLLPYCSLHCSLQKSTKNAQYGT